MGDCCVDVTGFPGAALLTKAARHEKKVSRLFNQRKGPNSFVLLLLVACSDHPPKEKLDPAFPRLRLRMDTRGEVCSSSFRNQYLCNPYGRPL